MNSTKCTIQETFYFVLAVLVEAHLDSAGWSTFWRNILPMLCNIWWTWFFFYYDIPF